MRKEASTVLYRTHRPKSFKEVRGQEHVVRVLESALESGRISHAYLFAGGRGTGKTTFARILARALKVSDKDLYEMDAASRTGVDDIRELREGVYVVPFESPYKCYIIDEAHMLSKSAWNALLKTLEEPPSHVLFILATTELDKVPDTIQSRCQVFRFTQPSREVLTDVVSDVAKKEKYTLERSAGELIALLAEGSFRDALSMLEKTFSVSKNKKISVAEVEIASGAPSGDVVRKIIEGITVRDSGVALSALHSATGGHMDMRVLTKLLIHRMRAVLLLRFAPDVAKHVAKEMTEADMELAERVAKNRGVTSDTLRALLEAYATMAYAALPHLPLELAIIDICAQGVAESQKTD
ncbi:MAG TPA: DNA polymerase III subunit gamma/tau [Candidatus Paceibacterota bacterium]